jgi:hypothetical protein
MGGRLGQSKGKAKQLAILSFQMEKCVHSYSSHLNSTYLCKTAKIAFFLIFKIFSPLNTKKNTIEK